MTSPTTSNAPAFVFPGQGSQAPGMGRELAACGAGPRQKIDAAHRITGLPVNELMTVADAATIADPEIAQLLVFVWSTVWLDQLTELGARPSVVAGHSLGEYSALVAAGSLEWETALRLVAARGRAMTAAARRRAGTMAAIVGVDPEVLAELCEQARAEHGQVNQVNIANYNSPRQAVISGTVQAVEAVTAAAQEAGALRAKRLPVGGAYHSPLMATAEQELAPLLIDATFEQPRVPFVSSITGRRVTDIEAYRSELLGQVTGPVRWQDTVQTLLARGTDTFVEVGPGRVLSGLGREMARQARHLTALEGLRSFQRPAQRTAQTA
jgi:[acyl-carrier-protein] S-malonyltransferase